MKIRAVAEELNIQINAKRSLDIYNELRDHHYEKFATHFAGNKPFQSPSIAPTTHDQRSSSQSMDEYNVYQRADYEPHHIEEQIKSFFPIFSEKKPQTILFNSGMGAITALLFFLQSVQKVKRILIGANAYYETKNFFKFGYGNYEFFNEYKVLNAEDYDVVWLEYPINCTLPDKYPLNTPLPLKETIEKILKYASSNPKRQISIVIDYTLSELPFNFSPLGKILPSNVSLFLLTSLQKHRQYGLDLVNLGAITLYSSGSAYEDITFFRGSLGVAPTQEAIWLMPGLKPDLINRLITDSGNNAKRIYKAIKQKLTPEIRAYYSLNSGFQSSFIFLIIDPALIPKHTKKPYLSELLIKEIVSAAKKSDACLVHGTSFGFPFTRIFKNSERYENTNALRVAIGYDEDMVKHNAEILVKGINVWKARYL
jgi:cystathionine beta-lyase/cystathionine gamma-synthase